VNEDVEHRQDITVFIEYWFGRFSVDGNSKRTQWFAEQCIKEMGECVLEFFERYFGEDA